MTREEHIIYLKNLRTALKLANNFSGETMESLNKAIEALEAEPCGDAISRKAAVVQLHHNKTGDDDIDVIIEKDIATIQTLPPVIPKQKTGEWIELKDQKPEAFENVLVKDIDGDVTCAYMCDETYTDMCFFEAFSGECIDDVIEWRRIPE